MFLFSHWLQLSLPTRHKIAAHFGIVKRGSTEVVDNVVKSDGYTVKEIEEKLNIDALQKYLGVGETDMLTLWLWMVDKIEGREQTKVNIDTTEKPWKAPSTEVIKKAVAGIKFIEDVVLDESRLDNIKPKRGRPAKVKLDSKDVQ